MQTSIPKAFLNRRIHSLMGLWLVVYLCEHLIVNSQAALWIGESGRGFVTLVNVIHNLPYLQVIESIVIGIPILIHAYWGIKYAKTSRTNDRKTDGSKPSILGNSRNKAYSWQRYTAWFLLFAIFIHTVEFRFLDYPIKVKGVEKDSYLVDLDMDSGLYTLSSRLGVTLYDSKKIEMENSALSKRQAERALKTAAKQMREEGLFPNEETYNSQSALLLQTSQSFEAKASLIAALQKMQISDNQVVACSDNFGTACLLMVRDHFKNPFYVVFYSLFVLAAVFHAFNGFWTFLITWGIILKVSAQKACLKISWAMMIVFAILGLVAIWGSYLINLKS